MSYITLVKIPFAPVKVRSLQKSNSDDEYFALHQNVMSINLPDLALRLSDIDKKLEGAIPQHSLTNILILDGKLDVLVCLYKVHKQLWHLEDQARSITVSARHIASIKREIDQKNSERHSLIDELDTSIRVLAGIDRPKRYSETIGEICDRLLILNLKIKNTLGLISDIAISHELHALCTKKYEQLKLWKAHLDNCLSDELIDIERGQANIPPRSEFKIYNYPELRHVGRSSDVPAPHDRA